MFAIYHGLNLTRHNVGPLREGFQPSESALRPKKERSAYSWDGQHRTRERPPGMNLFAIMKDGKIHKEALKA